MPANLITIITQFDPNYNYYSLGNQSWSQFEMIFGVEREFVDIFLKNSISWDIPHRYIINEAGDFQKLIESSDSFYMLFFSPQETWGEGLLASIKKYFLERQDLGKSLHEKNQINIDPLAVNRNIFFFLGKADLNGSVQPVMNFSPDLYEGFELASLIPRPTFLQPSVKFLIPKSFVIDNYISFKNTTDNINFNVALFTFNVLCYMYKVNNYFEPKYFSCYLDFTCITDTISIEKYKKVYMEEIVLKKEIFTFESNSFISKKYKMLEKDMLKRINS
ncbi:MAG: hypothetical protein ACRCXZ_10485 [Patescibacteria group bacterium]